MAKQPRECECGCGEMTKGGRFRPGHDARAHSAAKTGRLHDAIRHATGAHGTATEAPPRSRTAQGPSEPDEPREAAPEGPGEPATGTPVAPGMYVRAIINGKPHEGITYDVSRFGHISFLDEEGQQWLGYTGATWVLDSRKRKYNAAQRSALTKMGRAVV